MPFRPDRRRRGDRFLEWKIAIFSVAAVVGLAGIYLDERWLTGAAIALLAGGMSLRFLPGGGVARPAADEGLDADDGSDAEDHPDG